MALSLLCGGLGVASAANGTVHVAESSASSDPAVYTTAKVDTLLEGKADKTELGNKADATAVAVNTEKIATNKANITALQSELGNKADKSTVTTALEGKANKADVYSKTDADDRYATKDALDNKADQTYVDTEVGKKANKATTLAGYEITDAYTKEKTNELLNTKANAAEVYTRGDIDTKLEDVYSKTEVDGKITGEENARNIAIQTAISGEAENRKNAIDAAIAKEVAARNQAIKIEVDKEANARDTAIANAKNDLQTKITEEKTAREAAINTLKTKDTALEGQINTLDASSVKYDNATVKDKITLGLGGAGRTTITNLKDADLSDNSTDAVTGKQLNKTNEDLKTEAQTRADKDTLLSNRADALEKNTGGITRSDAKDETYIEKNVTVDNQGNIEAKGKVTANGVDAGAGDITTKGAVNSGTLEVTNTSHFKGDVMMDNKLNVTGNTSLNNTDVGGALNVTGASDLKGDVILGTTAANTVTVKGKSDFKEAVEMDNGLTVTSGDTTLQKTDVKGALNVTGESSLKNTTVDGTLSVNKETTLNGKLTANDEATFTKKVTMENDLEVKGELKTDKIAMEHTGTDADGTRYNSATTITADGITHIGEVEKSGVTTKSSFTHTEKGSETYAMKGDAIDQTETRSDVTADGVKTEVKDSKGNRTNTSQTTEVINGFAIDEDGNSSTTSQTAKDINGNVTDKDGNKTDMKVTATENSIQIQDKDGKNTNLQVNTMGSSKTEITNGDGKTTKTEQTATDIINTAKDGIIKNEANHIENTATTMKTTVTGQATEEFNGGLDTTVTGTENHTVNGKQINTIKNGQENIISGGQTNTITGGQTNNITGDQTTTITGNKKETVTENVTEDYQNDLTTTVGGNENHEVKGTKTETVEGKVTENYKAGQATNVTGDQDIKVSGTQTTTATDIKRNASSGMIDTIDNDYGTNTETKVAGKTTTDVSIKGTGEEGKYIRGANESRDYLIKGTLKNSETKTVDATSTEITDGKGKTSATIQDAKNLAGSVTNGTETGVSGIHANDNSVSIDSIVTDGNKYSVINQKKGSIQSTVVDGTNSTVILQDKDNVTIASSNGMVGLVGKDIVNNAQNTITNTAGTSITNQVKDSKVTTDANGTTFENNTPAVSDGGATTTKINGNQITTGRVNANELGVSDKDGDNTANLTVKAGEDGGVKASASNGTTTGSLDVTGDKVESSVKDGDNETSIKQTATDITNTAKDGTIKNDAKDIMNEASKSITNKVGDNTSETMKDGEITTSIKDGAKKNTVISTADGTSFFNSEAWEPVTGASGLGTAKNTTIKGNTITTGKVTMDYADVMIDLGVHGSAKVDNNLEVGGITTTKTLNVTEDAKVGRNLAVDGNATIAGDVTARDVTAKSYNVDGKTYIDANGINANNQKITNVADGSISEGSKDAVNGGQLYNVKNDLEGKVNKVGANAAAMANLHPMEFDPDSKWNIAAAIGNYGSETAAALGAFYRPNDDVMVNLSTAFGTGENMVGGGVSVRLGKGGNKLSREENNALKDQVDNLTARMDALLSVLNPNMSKDFPDVPENHWAYEAVSRLAGNDIVQGYPDGEFHGERTMTRYEMAEIIYNALSRGAEAEKELVEEFKPELQAMAASEKATAERAEG